jgi:hypothetical protein
VIRRLEHIEKSALRRGEYVLYLNGVQRVRRGAGWRTYALGSSVGKFTPLTARTLAELDRLAGELAGLRPPRLLEPGA